MMQAFYDTKNARDNSTETARRYCDLNHPLAYSPLDVEAACRELFHAVLQQCRYGFSGQPGVNRLGKTQGGVNGKNLQKIDGTCNCQTRITNVIMALRNWKCVYLDIMNYNDKIVSLANTPATTAADKQKNKDDNDKKAAAKRKKDEDLVKANAKVKAVTSATPQAGKGLTLGMPVNSGSAVDQLQGS
jgi:hypothetical protein